MYNDAKTFPNLFAVCMGFLFFTWPSHTVFAEVLCSDTCESSNDGTCNDGGLEWESYPGCFYGTDCTDCGVRTWPHAHDGEDICDDSCDDWSGTAEAYNDICEDGGVDAENAGCALGTDCQDCGTRIAPITTKSPTEAPQTTLFSGDDAPTQSGGGGGAGDGGGGNDDGTTTVSENSSGSDVVVPVASSLSCLAGLSALSVFAYLYYRYRKRKPVKPNENKSSSSPGNAV